jgi:transcription elongation factor GreA
MSQEMNKVPLTEDAMERLRKELAYLEGEGRDKVIDEIARARAHGDLSENAEYHAAREQQGMQEARIREIRQKLDNAEVIRGDDDKVVKPGKVVTIRYGGDPGTETYFIGTREEKGGTLDVLTPESPIGRALIGRSTGDTVVASVPACELKVEIVEIGAP